MDSNLEALSEGISYDSQDSDFDRFSDVSIEFENRWTPERKFSIEDALNKFAPKRESARQELFELLLEIDMTRGYETKSSISIEEYVRRFPHWRQIVESSARETEREFQNDPISRIGKLVGDYRIDEVLGEGGSGCVYKAFDSRFRRTVAIKFLKNADDQNEERLRFFDRELVAMGQIPYDSIFAQAHSCGQDDGVAYLVMEYVDGIDLQSYFRNADKRREKAGPLDWREATDYVAQIASGLTVIHNLGLVHRDVKPANVMLVAETSTQEPDDDAHRDVRSANATPNSNGKIRVLDLGFADFYRPTDGLDDGSKERIIAGTYAFLAPEARYGQQALDARSDLYCLGGTYLYLLTGLVPYDRFDPFSNESPISMREFLTTNDVELPDAVVDVLERLLQPDREKRYQTAQDAWNDLHALIKPKRSIRKTLAFAAVVALCALLAVAIGYVVYDYLGTGDKTRFAQAVDACNQGDLDRAFAIVQSVRPPKLPISDQPQYWTLLARGYLKSGEFSDALDSLYSAFETLELLPPNLSVAFALEFDARALETQALVLRGNKSVKDNPENGVRDLNEAIDKVSDFFERRGVLDATSKNQTLSAVADVYYWRARSYYALEENNNVEIVLPDLDACLHYNPDFPKARDWYGDLLCEQARQADKDDIEFQRYYAREAICQYKLETERPDASFDDKCATLRKTILLCEFLRDREAELDACEQLLKIDPESSVARRYRGRTALLESLANSPESTETSKKDKILSDLRDVASDSNYWIRVTDEDRSTRLTNDKVSSKEQKKGEIWMEIALAELKLGASRNYDACLNAIKEALKANRSQTVYVFDGIECDAYGLQREAYEKKLEICTNDNERRDLELKIEQTRRKETKSKAEEESR